MQLSRCERVSEMRDSVFARALRPLSGTKLSTQLPIIRDTTDEIRNSMSILGHSVDQQGEQLQTGDDEPPRDEPVEDNPDPDNRSETTSQSKFRSKLVSRLSNAIDWKPCEEAQVPEVPAPDVPVVVANGAEADVAESELFKADGWQQCFVQPYFDDYSVFESPHSFTVLGTLQVGDCVWAKPEAEGVDGYQMVMLKQGGAVEKKILSWEVTAAEVIEDPIEDPEVNMQPSQTIEDSSVDVRPTPTIEDSSVDVQLPLHHSDSGSASSSASREDRRESASVASDVAIIKDVAKMISLCERSSSSDLPSRIKGVGLGKHRLETSLEIGGSKSTRTETKLAEPMQDFPIHLDDVLDVDLSAVANWADDYSQNMDLNSLNKMLDQMSLDDRSGASTAQGQFICDEYALDVDVSLEARPISAEVAGSIADARLAWRSEHSQTPNLRPFAGDRRRAARSPLPSTGRSSAPPAPLRARPASSRQSPMPSSSATSRGATPLPLLRQGTATATPPWLNPSSALLVTQKGVLPPRDESPENDLEITRPSTAMGQADSPRAETRQRFMDEPPRARSSLGHCGAGSVDARRERGPQSALSGRVPEDRWRSATQAKPLRARAHRPEATPEIEARYASSGASNAPAAIQLSQALQGLC